MKNKRMLPPKGAAAFFSPTSDDAFKRAHPVGYRFLVALGLVALLGPMALWTALLVIGRLPAVGAWPLLGAFGAFLFGIGLFNDVAIIIRQFLGHLLSIVCFAIGAVLIGLSLLRML